MQLGDPKYRICSSTPSGKKVVFFCDWDTLWPPKQSFLGKPVYFQCGPIAGMPFRGKRILEEDYLDLLKLSPEDTYLSDLSLKLICENLHPGFLADNSHSALHTLCLVPTASIINTITSTEAAASLLNASRSPARILNLLRKLFSPKCTLGVVGYHALNPECEDIELDLVILADEVSDLLTARGVGKNLPSPLPSPYVTHLWPLCSRTQEYGTIDWFYSTRNPASELHKRLAWAPVKEWHHEFEGVVVDDSQSILSVPVWKLHDGTLLATVDGAVRGRFVNGDKVVGVGLLVDDPSKATVVMVQSGSNIVRI